MYICDEHSEGPALAYLISEPHACFGTKHFTTSLIIISTVVLFYITHTNTCICVYIYTVHINEQRIQMREEKGMKRQEDNSCLDQLKPSCLIYRCSLCRNPKSNDVKSAQLYIHACLLRAVRHMNNARI